MNLGNSSVDLVGSGGAGGSGVDTSTDNAIARFDGTTGSLQNSSVIVDDNGNVGIGSDLPNAKLEVNGYTKLGSNAPSIKFKKLTGTTSSTNGGAVTVSHGLDGDKIISIDVKVFPSSNVGTFSGEKVVTNREFSFRHGANDVYISNISGNSSGILSKPFTVLIIYEE